MHTVFLLPPGFAKGAVLRSHLHVPEAEHGFRGFALSILAERGVFVNNSQKEKRSMSETEQAQLTFLNLQGCSVEILKPCNLLIFQPFRHAPRVDYYGGKDENVSRAFP